MAEVNFIDSSKAFLGRGWSFPPKFNKGENSVEMTEAEQDIKDSLFIILSTNVGERVMQPEFGSHLSKLLFEPLNTTFSTYITEQIKNSILYFESRITLDSIDYLPDDLNGKVDMTLNYTINGTNTRSNIVFPFYLNEGTDLKQ